MFEFQLEGRVMSPVQPMAPGIDHWLAAVQKLNESELHQVVALTEAHDEVDAMRKAIGLCPALANPGPALAGRFGLPRDELVVYAFRLHTLASVLSRDARDAASPMDVYGWCSGMLEQRAERDEFFAARVSDL